MGASFFRVIGDEVKAPDYRVLVWLIATEGNQGFTHELTTSQPTMRINTTMDLRPFVLETWFPWFKGWKRGPLIVFLKAVSSG